ncbi:MAG: hypothetical protein HOJ16_07745 [Candidatus Peribacter sp.]|jgi:hypothetical protein|nr:hypothetical protein [Candidatus Peribacter sp.]
MIKSNTVEVVPGLSLSFRIQFKTNGKKGYYIAKCGDIFFVNKDRTALEGFLKSRGHEWWGQESMRWNRRVPE